MKSKLVCINPSITILGDKLLDNVTYTQCVNSETDLTVGQVASAQISFDTTYSGLNTNTVITYSTWQRQDSNWRQIGVFNVTSVEKVEKHYHVTAYDNVIKLDKDCSAWLSSCNYSTLDDLFWYIVKEFTGSYPVSHLVLNAGMTINPKDLVTSGITARQVLHYIAEINAGYMIANPSGLIKADLFATPSPAVSLDDSKYATLVMADESAPQIKKLTVQLNSGSTTLSTNSGTAEMVYLYNPLVYNYPASEYETELNNALTRLNGIGTYRPCKIHLYDDYGINAGDIITVDEQRVIVFTKTITPAGVDLTCTGNATRAVVVTQNTDRITNLEANKDNSKYITLDWLATNGNKIFNSTITVNDIYIPSGLGYLNNPACTSLVEVIQALLTKNEINPGSSTVNINMTSTAGPYHTYTTPAYDNSWAVSTSGSVSYAGNVITCTGTTNGSVSFTKTVIYPDQTSRVVTYTYNVNCYSYIVNHGYDFYLDYVGEQEFGNIAYSVVHGAQTVPYTENAVTDNAFIYVEPDVTAGLLIKFYDTGEYTFRKGDTVHAFPEQTYKILSV